MYNGAVTEQASNLLQKALTLSEEERAELACSLIDSLDPTVDESAASAWDQEIARRISDLDSGRAKTVPWEEVRGRLASKLSNGKQES
jgi:putative addiction module component (TIGR02574 family)